MTWFPCMLRLRHYIFYWGTFALHLSCSYPCHFALEYCLMTLICSISRHCKGSSKSRLKSGEASSFLLLLPLHPATEFLHHTSLMKDANVEYYLKYQVILKSVFL